MSGTAGPAGTAGTAAAGTAGEAADSTTDSTTDSEAGPAADAPQRGRPRSHRAHQAILAAASDLLLTRGLSAVSMDTVAERAGVSKATIYRWWPTKESLALDALFTEWSAVQPSVRDTGSLRSDLVSLIRPWARLIASRPYGPVIAQLIAAAQADPVFAAEYRQRFVEPRRELARAALQRAVERGEIPASTRMEVALDLIYGPIYHRLLHGHGPVNDRFVKEAIDMALDGIRGGTGR
ncbi:AcrR family transcriptional regulator [Catenulispora sp. GAS73]|uniref:TetR/AcrR family transcriptional regulator n=1 Tax=Catenulispora sp. GAS73 TaxID=3156269 RepID=UPI0035198785